MSFWPEGIDPRTAPILHLNLVSIETATGLHRFMVGTDGIFPDIDGNKWYGSTLFSVGELENALNGIAPSGEASLSYFQDPDQPELITELLNSGDAAIDGYPIRFYVQPIFREADKSAPRVPPLLFMTRTMRTLTEEESGVSRRRLTVSFEGPWEARARARRLQYTTTDHARLLGEANPSLEFMPQEFDNEEKLWG